MSVAARDKPKQSVAKPGVIQEQPESPYSDEGTLVMTIKLSSANNIRGSKGEHVNSFVRVQFADFDFKESSVIIDNANPEYNLSFDQSFVVDESLIDIFLNKTLSVTLVESLPKEKTAILGSCEISISKGFLKQPPRESDPDAPPFEPQVFMKESIPFTYVNPKLLAPAADNAKIVPECSVEISLSRPLLSPETLQASIFATIHLNDAIPVPEEWNVKDVNERDLNSNIFNYTTVITLPSERGVDRSLVITDGVLTACEVPILQDPIANAPQTIPFTEIKKEAQIEPAVVVLNDDGTPAEKIVEMKETKKVNWGKTFYTWLGPNTIETLRKPTDEKKSIQIEVVRVLQPKYASVVDLNVIKYKGFGSIDVGMLLYPNIGGIKGRFPLDAVDPSWLNENGTYSVPSPEALLKWKKDSNNLYRAIGTTISLELLLSNPLVDKKKLQALTKSVRDYIPRRTIPADLLFAKRSEKAEEDFRSKIREIVDKLVDEYKHVLEHEASGFVNAPNMDEEQRKKMFLFHLNKSGSYFTFKEQLKASVVQVVRERFQQKSPFAASSELHLFMSEVYVYLVDQLHVTMNQIFRPELASALNPTANKAGDFHALKEFADLAEADKRTEIAERYHQERVAKFEESLSSWFDYACFCMRNGISARGEECLKEILSRNEKHVPSLLVYGSLCCMKEEFEEARTYLEEAVKLEPKYVLANTILGVLYEIVGEDVESDRLFTYAKSLNEEAKVQGVESSSIFMQLAVFAVETHLADFADRALSRELLSNGRNVAPYLLLSKLELHRGNFQTAAQRIRDSLELDPHNPLVWASLGHLQFLQNKFAEAKHAFETVLSLSHESLAPNDIALIYVRLGAINLRNAVGVLSSSASSIGDENVDSSLARVSKTFYLKASALKPSSQSWLGAGRACFALKEFDEAEAAFSEANVLNNRDSEVWSHLAVLNLTLSRLTEANQCIAQALRLGIKDPEVLTMVGHGFLVEQQFAAAAECLRKALEIHPEDKTIQTLFEQAIQH